MQHIIVAMAGGDARSRAMAEHLSEVGIEVRTYALGTFDDAVKVLPSLEGALTGARAVVLPMPAFDEGLHIPCPYAAYELPGAAALFGRIGSSMPVFGGRVSPAAFALAADYGVRLYDYAVSDEVQWRNAVPTAEGALALAMQHLDITLNGAHTAILGFGRIGQLLALRLRAMGAGVTVAVRKMRDIARAEALGCRSFRLDGTDAPARLVAEQFDVVFNTVPYRLFSDEVLATVPARTLMIELASAPGGWNGAAHVPCRLVAAPGLPGKCAPRTAGIILADALVPLLEEVPER